MDESIDSDRGKDQLVAPPLGSNPTGEEEDAPAERADQGKTEEDVEALTLVREMVEDVQVLADVAAVRLVMGSPQATTSVLLPRRSTEENWKNRKICCTRYSYPAGNS
jgi:hypothetical protein